MPEYTPGYLTFAKLCLKNTTFIEASHQERAYHSGIYIDIYPDFAPEEEAEAAPPAKLAVSFSMPG